MTKKLLNFTAPYRRLLLTASLCLIAFAGFGAATTVSAQAKTVIHRLAISPIPQWTPSWCWLAVLEMIFKYHNVPNGFPGNGLDYDESFQLAIAASVAAAGTACHNYNLQACAQLSAGFHEDATQQIVDALRDYPVRQGKPSLDASSSSGDLSSDDIVAQIRDNRQPVVAGVNPSGNGFGAGPEHAVLIVGYRQTLDSDGNETKFEVYVNDPYDYALALSRGLIHANPWDHIRSASQQVTGQYRVPLDDWTSAMPWTETIDDIKKSS